MSDELRIYLVVGLGAALGSMARHACSSGTVALLGAGFPWGTLAVNTLGSLLIGLHAALSRPGGRWTTGPITRQFVQAGFCGGFTTFSLFSMETVGLLTQRDHVAAGINVGLSVGAWLLAVWLGYRIGLRFDRPVERAT